MSDRAVSARENSAAFLRSIGYVEQRTSEPALPLADRGPTLRRAGPALWKRMAGSALILTSGFAAGLVAMALFRPEPRPAAPVPRPAAESPADFTASGFVVPARSATVSSDEIGRVTRILVKAGDRVRRGQVVALLDDGRQEAALARADAALRVTQAQAAGARVALSATDPRYHRTRELSDRGFLSRAALDDVIAQRRVLQSSVDEFDRQVELQRRSLTEVRQSLGYRVIRAPFDGIVSQLNAQVGEIVSPSSAGSTFTRTGICTLIDRSEMFALVELDESLMAKVGGDGTIAVDIPALGRRLAGTLDTAAYEVDRSRGTGSFRIRIVQPPAGLLPNMEARVVFLHRRSVS